MTIDEQADVSLAWWKEWIKKEGKTTVYWRYGAIAAHEYDEYKVGYLRGVADRLSGVAYDNYQEMWDDAEMYGNFDPREYVDAEMMGKCHASGYVQGYKSI
jgi:hypothetical protein